MSKWSVPVSTPEDCVTWDLSPVGSRDLYNAKVLVRRGAILAFEISQPLAAVKSSEKTTFVHTLISCRQKMHLKISCFLLFWLLYIALFIFPNYFHQSNKNGSPDTDDDWPDLPWGLCQREARAVETSLTYIPSCHQETPGPRTRSVHSPIFVRPRIN